MAAFDDLQRASFDGIEFPINACDVHGGFRGHMHEYRRAPGGKAEKIGRRYYDIRMVGLFYQNAKGYPPDLFPSELRRLRETLESGETRDLVIPTIGTMRCYGVDWTERMSVQKRNGVDFEMRFNADTESLAGVDAIAAISVSLAEKVELLITLSDELPEEPDLFESIQNASNEISAVGDQVESYGNQIEAKAAGLVTQCENVSDTVKSLQEPKHWEVLEALKEVHFAALQLHQDAIQAQVKVVTFEVPATMSISQIASALYGDPARAAEILKLNAVGDAFAVPPGTQLRAYAA